MVVIPGMRDEAGGIGFGWGAAFGEARNDGGGGVIFCFDAHGYLAGAQPSGAAVIDAIAAGITGRRRLAAFNGKDTETHCVPMRVT